MLVAKERDIEPLLAAMRWAGSLFFDAGPVRDAFRNETMRLVYSPSTIKDGYLVQAMLILIICLDGSCQRERAVQVLGDLRRITLELGLHHKSYALANGNGDPVLEECWRRTWWEVYVLDGLVAGAHQTGNFPLSNVDTDVDLPCEEHRYISGVRRIFRKVVVTNPAHSGADILLGHIPTSVARRHG